MTKAIVAQMSMNELTGRILDMAQTGVYRESLFEAFKPVATKKQIKAAIALAKQFGLQTEPALRDAELGTYYQADIQKVSTFQSSIQNSVQLSAGDDMVERVLAATRAVKLMLLVSGGGAIALLLLGTSYMFAGKSEAAAIWWTSALCSGGIWMWQKSVAKPLL